MWIFCCERKLFSLQNLEFEIKIPTIYNSWSRSTTAWTFLTEPYTTVCPGQFHWSFILYIQFNFVVFNSASPKINPWIIELIILWSRNKRGDEEETERWARLRQKKSSNIGVNVHLLTCLCSLLIRICGIY